MVDWALREEFDSNYLAKVSALPLRVHKISLSEINGGSDLLVLYTKYNIKLNVLNSWTEFILSLVNVLRLKIKLQKLFFNGVSASD